MSKKCQNSGSDRQLSGADRRAIRRGLLAWYDRYKRDVPWRRRPGDAYAQLLAEVMLQQTQAATAAGYYERFLERFPTGEALKQARRLWGLGRLGHRPIGRVTRLLTHRRVTFHVYRGRVSDRQTIERIEDQPARWLERREVGRFGISRACDAVLALVGGR